MHTKISAIIKELGITKTDFAKKLGISQPFVSRICSGDAVPSDRTISDICRVFNVNRRYLEYGEEPMFMPELDSDTDFINEMLSDLDNPFTDIIRSIMRTYMELTPDDQQKAKNFAASLKDKLTSKDRD